LNVPIGERAAAIEAQHDEIAESKRRELEMRRVSSPQALLPQVRRTCSCDAAQFRLMDEAEAKGLGGTPYCSAAQNQHR
jgi:hypothetical protein